MAEADSCEAAEGLPISGGAIFEQDFSKLRESLEEGVWEVDGDEDLELYTAEAKDGDPGAVMLTKGGLASVAELVHQLDGRGMQVNHFTVDLICESIDVDSNGTFTVGLAFEEDLEEASFLAITIRRPRPETKLPREAGDPPEEAEPPKPVALLVNGQVAEENLGELPRRLELDIELSWKERMTAVKHRLRGWHASPEGPEGPEHEGIEGLMSTGFYTTSVPFDVAKAVFLRATGSITVRLLSLKCKGV